MMTKSISRTVRTDTPPGVIHRSRSWRWLNALVVQYIHPAEPRKPNWVHLPERVWQRQSALLMSLRERDFSAEHE